MLKVLVLAIVLIGGLYLLVAKTRIEDIGFRQLKKGEPDTVLGVVVIVLGLAVIAFLIFVPPREAASLTGRYYLGVFASGGIAWGIAQLRPSKIKHRRRSH